MSQLLNKLENKINSLPLIGKILSSIITFGILLLIAVIIGGIITELSYIQTYLYENVRSPTDPRLSRLRGLIIASMIIIILLLLFDTYLIFSDKHLISKEDIIAFSFSIFLAIILNLSFNLDLILKIDDVSNPNFSNNIDPFWITSILSFNALLILYSIGLISIIEDLKHFDNHR